jgi:hypothetical protein
MRWFLGHPIVALVVALMLAGLAFATEATPNNAVANALFAAAVVCVVLALIEWQGAAIKQRLPFTFRTPLTWKEPKPRPIRPIVEKGFLDHEKEYLAATNAATKTLGAMKREIEATNPKIQATTKEMARTQGASVDKRLAITTKSARVMEVHASGLARLEKTYRNQCDSMTRGLVEMLRTTPASGDLGTFPSAIQKAREQMAGFKSSTIGYRDATSGTRSLGVSQRVNEASDHLVAVLNLIIEDIDTVERAFQEAENVVAKRWPKPVVQ